MASSRKGFPVNWFKCLGATIGLCVMVSCFPKGSKDSAANTEKNDSLMLDGSPSPTPSETPPIDFSDLPDDGPQCHKMADGTYTWDQPDAKFNLFGLDTNLPNGYEGRCGQTACANIGANVCNICISPNDPKLLQLCKDKTPGTRPSNLIKALNTMCQNANNKKYTWSLKNSSNAADFDSILKDCPIPAVALLEWENKATQWHYVTIVSINVNPAGDITTLVINHAGTQETISYADFAAMMNHSLPMLPPFNTKNNLICRDAGVPAPPPPPPTPTPQCSESPTPPANTPTPMPTSSPTSSPSRTPTPMPTSSPTSSPSRTPTPMPTSSPTSSPSRTPTPMPTSSPTSSPSRTPTPMPTSSPTSSSSSSPTPMY